MIGTSAGGIQPLRELVSALAADFPAAVFVGPAHSTLAPISELPLLLTRVGRLPAKHPESGEPIRHGQIYVAPLEHHLLPRFEAPPPASAIVSSG
jgi:two-component system chemotaxis response regulator CheB